MALKIKKKRHRAQKNASFHNSLQKPIWLIRINLCDRNVIYSIIQSCYISVTFEIPFVK